MFLQHKKMANRLNKCTIHFMNKEITLLMLRMRIFYFSDSKINPLYVWNMLHQILLTLQLKTNKVIPYKFKPIILSCVHQMYHLQLY